MQLIVVYNTHFLCVVNLLDTGMGRKYRLPLVQVGEGSSRSRQRGEEELEATRIAKQARADANGQVWVGLGWA